MRTINTALLSFGMSGKVFHAPFIHLHPGFNLMGSWERSKQLISAQYPEVKSYSSMDQLLGDPNVELVVVNTPSYTHFEYAKKSLEAGKHIIVEKPFTTNVEEAKDLKALSEAKGLKISVFQNRRWDSDFRTVRQVINSGDLGDIVEVTIAYDRFNAVLSPKAHKETPGPGSGVVKDLSPHLIDQALVLFGMPVSVFADIAITRPLSQVPDYFEILMFYPKHRVRLHSGYFVREPVPSYTVNGMKGTFLKTRADVQEAKLLAGEVPMTDGWNEPDSERGFLHTERDGTVVKEKVATLPGSYYLFYDGVYQAMTGSKPMPVTADDGINIMRIIEAAEKSAKTRSVVDL